MKIFHVLPHLRRNGGVKVAIQQTHLLREKGYDCYTTAPGKDPLWDRLVNPYPNYHRCKILSWEKTRKILDKRDIFIFNWGEDIKNIHIDLSNNKKYYFAQACFFTPADNHRDTSRYGQPDVLKEEIEIVSVSQEVQNYFLYGFNKPSKIVNNWINTDVFRPGRVKKNRVGMIAHRKYSAERLVDRLERHGFEFVLIRGTENEVAKQMRSCEYFLSCSKGIHNGWRETEGLSLPSAEAMASGCIVLSYDNGGCREYMSNNVNGYIVFENDEEEMLKALLKAREQDNKQEIVENAVSTIKKRLDKETVFSQMKRAFSL